MTRPHQPAAALTGGDAPGKPPREAERIGQPRGWLPPPPRSGELSLARSPLLPSSACRGTRGAAAAGPGGGGRRPPAPAARTKAGPGEAAAATRESPPAAAATSVAAARTIPEPVARVPLRRADLQCPRPGNSRRDPQRGRETGGGERRSQPPGTPPACRGDAAPAGQAGRGRAALPQGRATAAPREGREPAAARRSGASPQLQRRRPGNKARPGRRACAAPGAAGPPLCGAGAREEPRRTRLLTGLRRSGCPGWEDAGGREGGRGAEPGPTRSGQAAAAALSRLVPPRWPGGSPRGRRQLRPLPRRQGNSEQRALPGPGPPPLPCPSPRSPPAPACGARSRGTARHFPRSRRGSCAGPGRPRRRQREAPPQRETMRRRRPARGCRALRCAPQASAPPGPPSRRPGLLSVAAGPL